MQAALDDYAEAASQLADSLAGLCAADTVASPHAAIPDDRVAPEDGARAALTASLSTAAAARDEYAAFAPSLTSVENVKNATAATLKTSESVDALTDRLLRQAQAVDAAVVAWDYRQAVADLNSAKQKLTDMVASAEAVLSTSQNRVSDAATRDALAAAITTVKDRLNLPIDANMFEAHQVREFIAQLHVDDTTLTDAQTAVEQSQQGWQSAQDAKKSSGPKTAATGVATPQTTGGGQSRSSGQQQSGQTSGSSPGPAATVYDGTNGKLNPSKLCSIGSSSYDGRTLYLRCGAAGAFKRMSAAFQAQFGTPIPVELAYRSYDEQVEMLATYGYPRAARPGTSNHGWGLAIDLPEYGEWDWGQPKREWVAANGPSYGWYAPRGLRQDGNNPEPWHFEYKG